tara:strand:- start:1896 stop:2525 length:630 start_codon:yes stop_codon:yes gene_type:complete
MAVSMKNKIILNKDYINLNRPAVFLDRDGVIIQDRHHISSPNDVELCPGVIDLLLFFRSKSYQIIIITNQSGIARGLFTWKDYEKVTEKIITLLGKPCPVSGIYANGYKGNGPANSWRKPNPYMLIQAKKDFSINLNDSILIGDRLSDLKAGVSAGLRKVFHVSTGHGNRERKIIKDYINNSNEFVWSKKSSKILLLDNLLNFPFDSIT